MQLSQYNPIFIKQVHEFAEFFGFETRNKYQISDSKQQIIGYAAEQQKGLFNFLVRQFLGHWRSFEVHFFTVDRKPFLIGYHPFRWYFERIEVKDFQGQKIGALQKRFSIFSKKFDVEDEMGKVIMQVSSPFWRIWTFTFSLHGRDIATISKKWSGVFSEVFTDKDNFMIDIKDVQVSENSRKVLLVASVFIDLLFFERKAG
jgi:uncharacterized protein YxjI